MKKFIVIITFAAVFGCVAEKVVQLDKLQQSGGVYVVPETQKPYSGKFVETRENVVIKAGSFKNGKLHGEVTTYRKNGLIGKVETFADDVLKKMEVYDENGKPIRLIQLGSFADSRDGKKYATVKIGTQTWMAENLNYNASGSKCYGNDESNCQKCGRLYNWQTAMESCPSGWHLPTNEEWDKLYRFADGTSGAKSPYDSETAGKKLKATSGWNNNGNGTDEFGFSALPCGDGGSSGYFRYADDTGYWWSASKDEINGYGAYYRYMNYDYERARWGSYVTSDLCSVRCVKD